MKTLITIEIFSGIVFPIVIIWFIGNIAHAFLTMKEDEFKSRFFCVSNWIKRDLKKGEKK